MTRLIDADDFFRTFPELANEPYINAPTVEERPKGEWSLVEHKKNIDLVCPCCGYNRCNLAYGFSIEEVREQIKEDKGNDFLLPAFCERCGAKLGFGGRQ